MKKAITLLVCLLIVFLSSCGDADIINETTSLTTQNITDNSTQPVTDVTKVHSNVEAVTVEIKTSPDDPYSYTVKDTYDEIIDFYVKYPNLDFECETYYFIYDIDGNGTEELLIGRPHMVGYPAYGPYDFEIMLDKLYTIKDGVVVEQDIMDWWSVMCIYERTVFDNGLIRYVGGGTNSLDYFYLKFADGEMKIQESLEHYGGEKHFIATQEMIDGIKSVESAAYKELEFHNKSEQKEITAEEFERMRAEIEGDAKPVEIKWKNIDEYGR